MTVLEGVYVANVTPFRDDADRSLDTRAYLAHVRWLAGNDVTGVVPFGTNGEGPSVATGEKTTVLDALVEEDLGIQLLPTVAEGNLPDTLALLSHVDRLPVAGVLVLPPYFFKPVDVAGLRDFYQRVLDATRHRVLVYHIPKYAVPVPAELVTSLKVWGVKDSGGDAAYSEAIRAAGQGVLLGTENDLTSRLPNADGAVSALANIVPEQVVELYRRIRDGDQERAKTLSAHLQAVRAMTKEYASPGLLKLLAQARHGTPMGTVRPPLVPVPGDYDVAAALERLTAPAAG
ncbi:MAG TPA: dihydrodipicolinate synthase family protein [Nocardioidaceae bacterium]